MKMRKTTPFSDAPVTQNDALVTHPRTLKPLKLKANDASERFFPEKITIRAREREKAKMLHMILHMNALPIATLSPGNASLASFVNEIKGLRGMRPVTSASFCVMGASSGNVQ